MNNKKLMIILSLILSVFLVGCSSQNETQEKVVDKTEKVQKEKKEEISSSAVSEHNKLMAIIAGTALSEFGQSVANNPSTANLVVQSKNMKDVLGNIKLEYNTTGDDEFNERLIFYMDTAWEASSLATRGALENNPSLIVEATEQLQTIQSVPQELELIIIKNK